MLPKSGRPLTIFNPNFPFFMLLHTIHLQVAVPEGSINHRLTFKTKAAIPNDVLIGNLNITLIIINTNILIKILYDSIAYVNKYCLCR